MTQRPTDFGQFVNQYALSKTLRFELKPMGNTAQMLTDAHVFEKDEMIHKKYVQTKPYLDRLHREFVQKALQEALLPGLSEYLEVFKQWKADKKTHEKDIQNREKELRREVVKLFDIQAKKWATVFPGLKNKDIQILQEEGVFAHLLKVKYGHEQEAIITDEVTGEPVSIFDSWKGFVGYFGKFFETRANFYKDDGTTTAIATRIINQNLKRFCNNMLIFESIQSKIDLAEVKQNFGKPLSEVFTVNFYNSCLLQDGIDFYNTILGGQTLENGEKLRGINECINKYRQDNKGERLPFLQPLEKQILSEKDKLVDEIENDEALLKTLNTFCKSAEEKMISLRDLIEDFVNNQDRYDLSHVYLSKEGFNTISRRWTPDTEIYERTLYDVLKAHKVVSASAMKKDGGYSFPDFIPLSCIKETLKKISSERFWKERYYAISGFDTKNIWDQFLGILSYEFMLLFERESINPETTDKYKAGYYVYKDNLEGLLQNFTLNQSSKVIIKNFADEVLHIYQMGSYFAVEKKRSWVSDYELGVFYTDSKIGYLQFYENAYKDIVQVYNKLRNYLTKKPYNKEKWKLNFEKPTLANGWPDSPEGNTQYCSFIFRNNSKYYLGITDSPKLFDEEKFPEAYRKDDEGFEKMVYKQVDAKTLYGSVYTGIFGTKYSDDQEKLDDQEVLRRLKTVLQTRASYFPEFSNFIEKIDKNSYETAKSLAQEISSGTFYNITFVPVSKEYLERGVYSVPKNKVGDTKERKLYLFQIKNKDWNEGANGAKNLHTLYFESLFSTDNMAQNFPIKLNGQAELFYREKTKKLKKEKITTQQGKTLEKGNRAFQKNRFTEDKIFFHVPITLNRTKSNPFKFNAKINDFLAGNPDINIIGVDRGEKHLAYFSVITQKGVILESGSLNEIAGVDYEKKLEEKADKREQARRDWEDVQGIKDLKKGYISQVVRKLADLAIKHNAIIVFEDLNMRFKQIRGGIEKSIYQQLEKALIDKLNYLVDKSEEDSTKAGHLLKAYQLAAPFETFKDMGKQTGIIFYTQAAYTSKIDPVTGWRPHLYLKYSNAEQAKKEILKFSNIDYLDGVFKFTYDIKNFRAQKEYPTQTVWTVYSCVERYRWNKSLNQNIGGYEHYKNVSESVQKLLADYGIDFERGNILKQIEELDTKRNEKFFSSLIYQFNLICQIRNTDVKAQTANAQDFILSPVEPFFDSRNGNGSYLPKNGDENGAYNIARKGIIILDKITRFMREENNVDKMTWNNLYVSHVEWDNWARTNKAIE